MCTQPPFDSSAMDGYALRSAETVQASADHAVSFSVVGTITAGMGMNGLEELPACHAGEAVRIMTGAPLPIGADCVIRQEDTAEESMGDELRVEISRVVKMGDCVCRKGENFRTGEVLLKAGTSLDAAAIGLAASSGNRQLCVRRPQRAVLLITGSEIVRAGEEFAEGQVLDAMESYLSIRLEELGITPVACRVVPDDPAQLVRAVLELSEQADAILSTGGVSVGIHDYMQRVVEEVGGTVVFHGIAMKPGMPTMLSVVRGVPMLSLSGNPSAAAVAFELLMPHVQEAVFHRAAEAVLANNFEKNSPVRRFLWGYSDGGQVWAAEHQRNSNIRSMVGQNCLIDIPAGSGPLTAGSSVTVHWLKNVSTS